nr:hypothetical protein [Tanacetum cinerariifolium]
LKLLTLPFSESGIGGCYRRRTRYGLKSSKLYMVRNVAFITMVASITIVPRVSVSRKIPRPNLRARNSSDLLDMLVEISFEEINRVEDTCVWSLGIDGSFSVKDARCIIDSDLWKVCNDYGTVVDVFIPNKKSKAGKRFTFVRFIKVFNFDRLIENLKTIWIGRFHLSANPARFDRPKAPTFQKDKPVSSGNVTGFRQPNVQYHGGSNVTILTPPFLLKTTMVLDDSFLVNRDLVNCVMGEVLQFSSINNLQMVELEDGYDDLFARKRICIKTSQTENILESFKIIVKGKVFWARAKELFVWSPSFKEVPEKVMCSDDKSVKINEEANSLNNGVEDSDSEVVSDTYFGDNASIKQNAPEVESDRPSNRSEKSNSRALEEVANSVDRSSSESINNGIKLKEGGSILEILEEMITVGQTMGFYMKGCTKDMEKIIGTQGEELISKHKVSFLSIQETEMESVSTIEHLSDHRPILLREVISDFGPTLFGFYHSWLGLPGFGDLVTKSWNSFVLDDSNGHSKDLKSKLSDIDKMLDQSRFTDDILLSRMEVLKQLHDV